MAGALLAYFGADVIKASCYCCSFSLCWLAVVDATSPPRAERCPLPPLPAAVASAAAASASHCPQVEPPERGDALRHLRMLDPTGTSLWWRSYVSRLV